MTSPVANRPANSSISPIDGSKSDVQAGQIPQSAANLKVVYQNIGGKGRLGSSASQREIAKADNWHIAKPAGMLRAQSAPVLGSKKSSAPVSKSAFIDSEFMKGLRSPFEDDVSNKAPSTVEKEAVNQMTHSPFAESSGPENVNARRQAQGNSSMTARVADPSPSTAKEQPPIKTRPRAKARALRETAAKRTDFLQGLSVGKLLSRATKDESGDIHDERKDKALEGMATVKLKTGSLHKVKLKKAVTSAARTLGTTARVLTTEQQKHLRALLPEELASELNDAEVAKVHEDMRKGSDGSKKRLKSLMEGNLPTVASGKETGIYLTGFALGRDFLLYRTGRVSLLCDNLVDRIGLLPGGASLVKDLDPFQRSHFSLADVIKLAKLLPDPHGSQMLVFLEGVNRGFHSRDPQHLGDAVG